MNKKGFLDVSIHKLSPLIQDIRFWILFLFVLRLYGIWFPPLEVEHNWRQTTVTMVARNFFEVDNNIFYPRLDIGGELSGITGMEFPILNYLIYLMSEIFGYAHWYGRLINLIVSSFGVWYFFKLLRFKFDKKIAFNASFLLLSSLWFAYSRKVMPDTFATSLAIIALYHGFRYFGSVNSKSLFYYFIFGLLSLLAKIPVVFLFLYMAFPMLQGKIFKKHKVMFLLVNIAFLVPVLYWYFVWSPYLTDYYGFWHFFMGKNMLIGLEELMEEPLATASRLFFTPLRISGMVLLFSSFVFLWYKKQFLPIVLYTIGTISFFILIALKAGWTFHHHNYYILVLVPVFVIPLAFFLKYLPKYVVVFLLTFCLIEGVSSQIHEFRIKEDHGVLLTLESVLNKHLQPDDKIAINSGKYPTAMYAAHRRGWVMSTNSLKYSVNRQIIRNYDCKVIVILKRVFGTNIDLPYPILEDNKDFKIYQIQE